jgi:signal transduction histidine kinase
MVNADTDQLQAIFGHLVQNAQDATPDTGSIDIIQTEDADSCILQIIDTGHGMDEDFIKYQLFKPFKSTKGKGMGIGVYETREIINKINGTIDVESTVGEGTCFTVTLPKIV